MHIYNNYNDTIITLQTKIDITDFHQSLYAQKVDSTERERERERERRGGWGGGGADRQTDKIKKYCHIMMKNGFVHVSQRSI